MLQTFESVKELPTYTNVRSKLIDITPRKFVNFTITPNILFADNVWMFDEFKRFSGEDWAYNYDFTQLDPTYKNYAKYMMLRELFKKNNHFTTVKAKFYVIKDFINFLSEHHMFFPNLIDTAFLKVFLAHVPSERNLTDKKQALRMFLSEIELRVSGVNFSDCYDYLKVIDTVKVKAEREKGKHKFVPKQVHNKIISLAIKDLRNEDLPFTQRAAACMIVLLAETGMRIGEFRILEVNMLEEISVKVESEVFYYLNFKTYKTVKEKDFKWTRSFITENAKIAYETLTEIFRERRNSQYLYVNNKGSEVSKTLLRIRLVQFFYRHQNEIQFDKIIDYEENQFSVTRKRNFSALKFVPDDEIDKDIYYITFHQYRVVLATILYEKGYYLDFIRQHMNHLTEAMTKHYIRLDEINNLEVNAVETLIKRSSKDGTALNTDLNESSNKHLKEELQSEQYQEIYDSINKFLKKNKLNIFTDIKEIISKLSRTDNPIADMELGICAKSFNKLCERNQYISSINDAYYLGVQIHTLDDLPFSIKRFQEKSDIIAYNERLYKKNPKYRNEFERELKGIKKYIERKLNPELLLLKDEISINGLEEVYNKYPQLADIIRNIKSIEEEAQKWIEKTLLLQLITV
ncbi:tyrosine-type recombinase/integrase [Bacillus sp. OK048]|uniref:tyrosine-type recombinase/integrase n=1 Tax=Bacillus sp. OK048 TaxID=1882761 RepID=UPI0008910E93|nr:tyrosine-type recombinase/integrase [Bacillus sp. OK048]SDM41599.1 Phage integrase family protein [Bacillus sp. OK048]